MIGYCLCFLAASLQDGGAPVAEPVGEVVQFVREYESAAPRATSVVDVGILPDDMDPSAPWDVNRLHRRETVEWLWDGVRSRMRRIESDRDPPELSGETGVRDTSIWNGHEWIARNASKRSCVIMSRPVLTPLGDCFAFFCGLPWPSMAGTQGFSESISLGRVLKQQSDLTERRIEISQNDADSVLLEVVCDLDRRAPSQVTRTIVARQGDPDAGKPLSIVHYRVTEWREVDGRTIPWRAIREAKLFRDSEGEATREKPTIQRIAYVRRSFEVVPGDVALDSMFARPPLVEGDSVADKTLKLAYTIGDDYLNVDGRVYRIPEKVRTYVGPDDLKRLMQDERTHPMEP